MGMKDKVTNKLLQATSDKTELNKKMLAWNKSFVEVNKTLGGNINNLKNDSEFVRLICDHIGSMTDQYAAREYRKLYEPEYF